MQSHPKIGASIPNVSNRNNNINIQKNTKFFHRSNSTLNPSYFNNKHINNNNANFKLNGEFNINGTEQSNLLEEFTETKSKNSLHIKRSNNDKEKYPDRINLDRHGLTSIPFIDNENNLRLLSLQHNLIHVFNVPKTSKQIVQNETNPKPPITKTTQLHYNPTNFNKTICNNLPISEKKNQLTGNNLMINNSNQNKGLTSSFISNTSYLSSTKYDVRKTRLSHMMSFNTDNLGLIKSRNSIKSSNKLTSTTIPVQNSPPYLLPGFSVCLENLVFLDLYDNQIEKISNLDGLKSLTVLLLGKNRIIDISGITSLKSTLRVLDLHGNRISNITQHICQLQELKSLNLAGNLLRNIKNGDFNNMFCLKELNLKRNRIKKMSGFDDLRNLERLWLCHNDIQKIDDMSCIAKAVNLKEITIENNPISLGGECVSFLVSYLPNLLLLSQMQVNDQVKQAAMNWKKNKEISDKNYLNVNGDIRREEVISNARTSWELLRSHQMKLNTNEPIKEKKNQISNNESYKELSANILSKSITRRQKTMLDLSSQDKRIKEQISNDNSIDLNIENIDSACAIEENQIESNDDCIRLPPILPPPMEKQVSHEKSNQSDVSSLGPNIDSSSSCRSSDNEDAKKEKIVVEEIPVKNDPKIEIVNSDIEIKLTKVSEEKIINEVKPKIKNEPIKKKIEKTIENGQTTSSEISSVITNSSDSRRQPFKIRSANSQRRNTNESLLRPQTARTNIFANTNIIPETNYNTTMENTSTNTNNPLNKKPSNFRDREQGGDYLIEICGRYLNVYGLGAIKYIDKQWNVQKTNDVHTVKFSYINFNNIAVTLHRIKARFPNAENYSFRETNITNNGQLNALAELQGLHSLTIDPDGNPICLKEWRYYAIYRLSHWGLKQINGVDVTDKEIQTAEGLYKGLSDLVVWSLPDLFLQPLLARLRIEENCLPTKMSASEWLLKEDPSLKCVVGKEALQWKKTVTAQDEITARQKGKKDLTLMLENTCNAVEKLQLLEHLWTNMLVEINRNTLLDYVQIDVYVKNLMEKIIK